MKKIFLTLNILIASAVFVGNYFYLTEGGLLLKSLCSSGFALMGSLNLLYAVLNRQKDLKYNISMAAGLILAMLGDIIIGSDFIIGAALFAAGHIFYYVAQCMFIKPHWLDHLISGMLFAGTTVFLLICPLLSFPEPVMRWVCIVYALIISLMAGKALSDFIRKPGFLTAVLAFGSILFFFSDLMLVFDWFIGLWEITDELCMSTYYPAQCLLAFSAFILTEQRKNK